MYQTEDSKFLATVASRMTALLSMQADIDFSVESLCTTCKLFQRRCIVLYCILFFRLMYFLHEVIMNIAGVS